MGDNSWSTYNKVGKLMCNYLGINQKKLKQYYVLSIYPVYIISVIILMSKGRP